MCRYSPCIVENTPFEVFLSNQDDYFHIMADSNHVVTATDVANATGQSLETVARGWHALATDGAEDPESESTDCRRLFSDD